MPISVFCAFEGGGAKGIAHLSTLRGLEWNRENGRLRNKSHRLTHRLEHRAYAGTSAGAIVAALAAAGFTAEELLDDSGMPRPGLGARPASRGIAAWAGSAADRAMDLLGSAGRLFGRRRPAGAGNGPVAPVRLPVFSPALERVGIFGTKSLLHLFGRPSWVKLRIIGLVFHLLRKAWIRWSVLFCGIVLLGFGVFLAPVSTLVVLAVLGVLGWLLLTRYRGWVSLDEIEVLINRLLCSKLIDDWSPQAPAPALTFARMRELSGRDLMVIAAELETAKLKLFSADETPEVPVARAVMASAAIPMVFRPVEIRDKRTGIRRTYCDGGIVSNLPAWVFDNAIMVDPMAMVVTSEIVAGDLPAASGRVRGSTASRSASASPFPSAGQRRPAESVPAVGGGIRLVERVMRAGLFGRRILETRGIRNHLTLLLPVEAIGTLDFIDTASHLPLLRDKLDASIRDGIAFHVLAMSVAESRREAYAEALEKSLGPGVVSGICVILMKAEIAEDRTARNLRPWHASGPRDCRWHVYDAMIREVIRTGKPAYATGAGSGDSDWCVAVRAEGEHTASLLCLGIGGAERVEVIARLISNREYVIKKVAGAETS